MKPTCCPNMNELIQTRVFKALCDPSRVSILARLANAGEPRTVSKINECCPISISVVSRHLAILRDAGILKAEKKGKEVFYSISCGNLVGTLRALADAMEACCPPEKSEKGQTR